MAGDAFAAILDKKESLKAAMKDTDVGVRPTKKAAERATAEADTKAKAVVLEGREKPDKYNTPRKPGESLGDFGTRLDKARKDYVP
jgi:hypothetical protein